MEWGEGRYIENKNIYPRAFQISYYNEVKDYEHRNNGKLLKKLNVGPMVVLYDLLLRILC